MGNVHGNANAHVHVSSEAAAATVARQQWCWRWWRRRRSAAGGGSDDGSAVGGDQEASGGSTLFDDATGGGGGGGGWDAVGWGARDGGAVGGDQEAGGSFSGCCFRGTGSTATSSVLGIIVVGGVVIATNTTGTFGPRHASAGSSLTTGYGASITTRQFFSTASAYIAVTIKRGGGVEYAGYSRGGEPGARLI